MGGVRQGVVNTFIVPTLDQIADVTAIADPVLADLQVIPKGVYDNITAGMEVHASNLASDRCH